MKRLNLKAAPPPRKRHLDRHNYSPQSSKETVRLTAEMTAALEQAISAMVARVYRRLEERISNCRIVQFWNAETVFELRVAHDDERVARLDELFFTADPRRPWPVSDAVAMELQLLFDCQIVEAA